jgi:hypothetical protein
MRCLHCQQENQEGARYCEACGSPLARPCPSCGNLGRPIAIFCDQCGTSLTGQPATAKPHPVLPRAQAPQSYTPQHLAEKILTSKTALEGERKQVTVLFAISRARWSYSPTATPKKPVNSSTLCSNA